MKKKPRCHDEVTGKEVQFEKEFIEIINEYKSSERKNMDLRYFSFIGEKKESMGDFPLEKLHLMQTDLRHWDTIDEMALFVKNGGFWTLDYLKEYAESKNLSRVSPLIAITRFEDGECYLHDGMHRSISTSLGGREYLREDEYVLTEWTYDYYTEFAPHNNWYTPFDPRTNSRLPDFAKFKNSAKEFCQKHNITNMMMFEPWLLQHQHEYLAQKEFDTISEFLNHNLHKLSPALHHSLLA